MRTLTFAVRAVPLLLVFCSLASRAENASLRVVWVDAKGVIQQSAQVKKSAWAWLKRDPAAQFASPALRLWINTEIPDEWQLLEHSVQGAILVEPFVPAKRLVIDLLSRDAAVHAKFKTEDGKLVETAMLFMFAIPQPIAVVHPNCSQLDYQLSAQQKASKNLFVGVSCARQAGKTNFRFFTSLDAKWAGDRKPAAESGETDHALVFESKSEGLTKDSKMKEVFNVAVEDGEKNQSSYTMKYREKSWKRLGQPFVQAGLGFTSLNYTQTDVAPFSELASTVKATFRTPFFFENVDVAVTVFATTLVFSTSDPSVQARYLGVNGRIGYVFPFVKEPWSLSLLGGWYYTTMFVTGSAFGYKNMMGPQLFPSLRRTFANKKYSLSGYAKFSPIASSLQILPPLTSREIAGGLGFGWNFRKDHSLGVTLDYSDLYVEVDERVITTQTVSLGISYSYSF